MTSARVALPLDARNSKAEVNKRCEEAAAVTRAACAAFHAAPTLTPTACAAARGIVTVACESNESSHDWPSFDGRIDLMVPLTDADFAEALFAAGLEACGFIAATFVATGFLTCGFDFDAVFAGAADFFVDVTTGFTVAFTALLADFLAVAVAVALLLTDLVDAVFARALFDFLAMMKLA